MAGSILILVGMLGAVMTLWFPMDPIGSEATPAGTGHVVLAGAISVASMARQKAPAPRSAANRTS